MTRYEAYLMQGMSQIVTFDSDATDPAELEAAAWNEGSIEPNSSNDFEIDGDGGIYYVRPVGGDTTPVAGEMFREAQAQATQQPGEQPVVAEPAPPVEVAELVPPAERPQAGHPELTAGSPREFLPVRSVSVNQFDTSDLITVGVNPKGRAAVQIDELVIYGDPTELVEFAVALTHAATREQWRLLAEKKTQRGA